MEEVEEAALLPAAPTVRSGKLDRPVQYRFFRRSNFLALRGAGDHRVTSREDAVAMAAVHAHYCSDTVSSIAQHAAYLLNSPLWRFWWD